jgi:hypothetical protein
LAEEYQPGDIISYNEMCLGVGASLQRGMNFRMQGNLSIVLMSLREGAPYEDRVEDEGRILIYEGHDCPKRAGEADPKRIDQPEFNPGGSRTQNGLFAEAARRHKESGISPEKVKVFEKIRQGIWVYNGVFELIDYWTDASAGRKVFKFRLRLVGSDAIHQPTEIQPEVEDDRVIPSAVMLEVWKRDKGRCRRCGTNQGLHFDHIIPYSKGGSSKDPANIQILCGRHNLAKRDKIE